MLEVIHAFTFVLFDLYIYIYSSYALKDYI